MAEVTGHPSDLENHGRRRLHSPPKERRNAPAWEEDGSAAEAGRRHELRCKRTADGHAWAKVSTALLEAADRGKAGIPSQARFSVALHWAQKERSEGGQGTGENLSKQYLPRGEGRLPLPERQKALVSCSDPRVMWSKTP